MASRFAGCLLGGAVGDALGAPVEFLSLEEIRQGFVAADGLVREYSPAYGGPGRITDDTQMTLFTAEGLLRAHNRQLQRGIGGDPVELIWHAYLRWLVTQGGQPHFPHGGAGHGWLLTLPALHTRRAPGGTCLSALAGGRPGGIAGPANDSKGCGGVMRVAPVGLAAPGVRTPREAFRLGAEVAALTHGHPSGYLAAGVFAYVVCSLVAGTALRVAVEAALAELGAGDYQGTQETRDAVGRALALADAAETGAPPPAPEAVETLGGGWVAGEALAIALYCALTAAPEDVEGAVALSVTHSGDSDSTGSLTGQLLGTLWGREVIPARWLAPLELRPEIESVAGDMYRHFGRPGEPFNPREDWDRYPGG